jgi:hypothetical protein
VELTPERVELLNVALNEATLLGAEVETELHAAAITLSMLSLPVDGPPPEDPRVQLLLRPVGRVCASLRHGRWDDANAPVEPFRIDELLAVLGRVGGHAVYGWEFFDVPEEKDFARWKDRLSLDWEAPGDSGRSHTLVLFQEADKAHLDLCFWFDHLVIYTASYEETPLDDFAAAGKRWWDALYADDPRTAGAGIVPLTTEATEAPEKTLDDLRSG